MPVVDHAVHPLTQHSKVISGCYNRKGMKHGYWCYVRQYFDDGNFMMTYEYIPHTMSTKCRQINNLPECEGCTAEKDVAYIEQMKHL